MKSLLITAGLTMALMLNMAGGAAAITSEEPMRLEVDAQKLVILKKTDTATGSQTTAEAPQFSLEVADSDEKRMRGLMYRGDLPEDRAMIFVFDNLRGVAMWMRNTPLPLDMLFVRPDGSIARILENTTPFSEAILSSGEPVQFVIEINGGIAQKLGLSAGDMVRHRIICGSCE